MKRWRRDLKHCNRVISPLSLYLAYIVIFYVLCCVWSCFTLSSCHSYVGFMTDFFFSQCVTYVYFSHSLLSVLLDDLRSSLCSCLALRVALYSSFSIHLIYMCVCAWAYMQIALTRARLSLYVIGGCLCTVSLCGFSSTFPIICIRKLLIFKLFVALCLLSWIIVCGLSVVAYFFS